MEWYSFWRWFAFGYGRKAGYRRLLTPWIGVDAFVAIMFLIFAQGDFGKIHLSVVVPAAGFLVGLSIAVASAAHTVLVSPEITDLSEASGGNQADYVYVFLLSVIVVIAAAVFWVFASLVGGSGAGWKVFWAVIAASFSTAVRLAWGAMSDLASIVLAIHAVRRAKTESNVEYHLAPPTRAPLSASPRRCPRRPWRCRRRG